MKYDNISETISFRPEGCPTEPIVLKYAYNTHNNAHQTLSKSWRLLASTVNNKHNLSQNQASSNASLEVEYFYKSTFITT